MAITDPIRHRPYFPYIVEGLCALALYMAVYLIFLIILFLLEKPEEMGDNRWGILVVFIPMLYECFFGNFKVMLLLIPEVKLNLYRCEELRLIAWRQVPETILKYDSVLSWFFSSYKYVEKEKLYFERADGSVVELKCVFHGLSQAENNTRIKRKVWRAKYNGKLSMFKVPSQYDKRTVDSSHVETIVYGRLSKVIITRGSVRPGKDGLWNRANFS